MHFKEQTVKKEKNYLGWSTTAGAERSDMGKDKLRSKTINAFRTGNYFPYYSFPDKDECVQLTGI